MTSQFGSFAFLKLSFPSYETWRPGCGRGCGRDSVPCCVCLESLNVCFFRGGRISILPWAPELRSSSWADETLLKVLGAGGVGAGLSAHLLLQPHGSRPGQA